MAVNLPPCPYCESNINVKFPCCGYLCIKCGRFFDEEDIEELNKGIRNGNNNEVEKASQ